MKNLIKFILIISTGCVNVNAQSSKILYSFPGKVNDLLINEIQLNGNYYDSTKYIIFLRLNKPNDTLITCSILRQTKEIPEGNRAWNVDSLLKSTNRYFKVSDNFFIPIINNYDLYFSQWRTGLLTHNYSYIEFNYSGKIYESLLITNK